MIHSKFHLNYTQPSVTAGYCYFQCKKFRSAGALPRHLAHDRDGRTDTRLRMGSLSKFYPQV